MVAMRMVRLSAALAVAPLSLQVLAAAGAPNAAAASITNSALLYPLLPSRSLVSALAAPPALADSLCTHCFDCHHGARGRGGFDLNRAIDAAARLRGNLAGGRHRDPSGAASTPTGANVPKAAVSVLRVIRARLARQDMPPIEETERPSAAEYAAMIAAIDASVPPARREVPLVRRLNRWQVANSIRDTIGSLGAEASAGTRAAPSAATKVGPSASAGEPTAPQVNANSVTAPGASTDLSVDASTQPPAFAVEIRATSGG